ncbi:MAG: GntR family transcriptional regulator [Victivallaceae bacterium]
MNIAIDKSVPAPLYRQLKKQLLVMMESGTLQSDMPIPTEMELAEKYEISRTVVRHALSELAGEGYLHRIPGKGTFVTSRSEEKRKNEITVSKAVALIMPCTQSETLFTDTIIGAEKGTAARKYDFIFFNSQNSAGIESENIRRLRKKVKGLIIFLSDDYTHPELTGSTIAGLKKEGYPFVLIDRPFPGIETDYVATDCFSGACEATTWLIKRNYRQIVCVTADDWMLRTPLVERLNGYRKAMDDNDKLLSILTVKRNNTAEKSIKDFFKDKKNCGIFCTENWTALMIQKLASRGELDLPSPNSIIKFDQYKEPVIDLTATVVQPMERIGAVAAELLADKIEGKSKTVKQIRIKPELKLLNDQFRKPLSAIELGANTEKN